MLTNGRLDASGRPLCVSDSPGGASTKSKILWGAPGDQSPERTLTKEQGAPSTLNIPL